MDNDTERRIAIMKARGIRFLDEMPEGWRRIKGCRGLNGWFWACNGRSRFVPGYEHALIREA